VEFVKLVFLFFVEPLWQFSGENKNRQVDKPSRSTAKKSWKKVGFFDFLNFHAACLGRGSRGPKLSFWEKVDLGRLYKVFVVWCWCTNYWKQSWAVGVELFSYVSTFSFPSKIGVTSGHVTDNAQKGFSPVMLFFN